MTPRVSLVMPNRDNEAVLGMVLERLARTTTYPDVELLVVDDGSQDRSREILRSWSGFPGDVRVIELEPGGVVRALNTGLEAATGELVVQLDADASIETPGWLERMVEFFSSDERIGVAVAKVVLDNGELHALGINVIGPAGLHDRGSTPNERLGRRTWHSHVDRVREGSSSLEDVAAEVDSGIGCCMLYRRSVALEAGGYDMGFSPVWFDDLDLCLRIRLAGYKAFYLPDVRVLHHQGARARPDEQPPLRTRALGKVVNTGGRVVPPSWRRPIGRRLGLDRPPAGHRERLRHHYAYWKSKWGWDLLNPDMTAVRARYGDTELCWASDLARRRAGEEIAAAYEASRRSSVPQA